MTQTWKEPATHIGGVKLGASIALASLLAACDGGSIIIGIDDGSSSSTPSSHSSMPQTSSVDASSEWSSSEWASSQSSVPHHHSSSAMTSSMASSTYGSVSSSHASSDAHHEFEAVINDFVGYEGWHVGDYSIGATHARLGGAHLGGAGMSDDYMRKTFMNDAAYQSLHGEHAEFAAGSIIVKETFTYEMGEHDSHKMLASSGGLVAMVKRGGDYNKSHNGWEYFILENDLSSVVAQGEMPANMNCSGCHGKAGAGEIAGLDYVFTPMQYEIDTHLFGSYTQWDLIEYNAGPAALAGGAHIDHAQLRRTFQKQVLAYPDMTASATDEHPAHYAYPVGTTLVKEITHDDKIAQIVAMVKRGGDFDPSGNNWEYFMLDPHNPSKVLINDAGVAVRGALAACKGCHSKAMGDQGVDYVFKHHDAPFNNHSMKMEFIANNKTFMEYSDSGQVSHAEKEWMLADYVIGNHNPFISGAHNASTGDTQGDYVRAVFKNHNAQKVHYGDEHAVGSVIVKETFSTLSSAKVFAEPGGILAMAKRGGSYNPDHGGWEWLALDKNGRIRARSPMLKEGACNQCHSHGEDYSFATPSEHVATIKDFQHYKTWMLIDDDQSSSSPHGGHNRQTFKKQAHASPFVFANGEYPIGTTLVKQMFNSDGSTNRVVGMVKRGGNFDPTNNNWDWFILSNDGSSITSRSGAVCTGCHSKAEAEGGMDYVFPHPDDPVRHPH